jgi:hypothetical protein
MEGRSCHVASECGTWKLKPAKRVVGRSQTRPSNRNAASSGMKCAAHEMGEEVVWWGVQPLQITSLLTFVLITINRTFVLYSRSAIGNEYKDTKSGTCNQAFFRSENPSRGWCGPQPR